MSFQPAPSQLFFTKNDPNDVRLGDLAKSLPPCSSGEAFGATAREIVTTAGQHKRNFFLAGYPDDEGIRINGGRLGAQEAPNEIRRWLYRMTPSLHGKNDFQLWDLGDLKPSSHALENRHELGAACAEAALRAGARWIAFGGGHDYGYAEAKGFLSWAAKRPASESSVRPLVINFDAHLDVRPPTSGLSSGTPFYRMLELGLPVDFAEIGIQAHCNSRAHLEWAKSRGARILTQEELETASEPMVTAVTRLLGDWLHRPRPTFVSVDIDGFSSAVAPGCSQSWATGFMPEQFFPVLNLLCSRLDVRALGIYEVSPALDHDGRTAKLAAQIAHRALTT